MVKTECPLLTSKMTFPELAEYCGISPEELWEVILGKHTVPEVAEKLAKLTGMAVHTFYKPITRSRNCFIDWMAASVGVQGRHLRLLIQGKKPAGRKTAVTLADFTGIPRDAWLFPTDDNNWMRTRLNKKTGK